MEQKIRKYKIKMDIGNFSTKAQSTFEIELTDKAFKQLYQGFVRMQKNLDNVKNSPAAYLFDIDQINTECRVCGTGIADGSKWCNEHDPFAFEEEI